MLEPQETWPPRATCTGVPAVGLPHIVMLVASGPFRRQRAAFRGVPWADVSSRSRCGLGKLGAEASRANPLDRELGWPHPATFARLPPPRGRAPVPKDRFSVRRLVPSGFGIGSGGASPSAWRFQEHGIVSMPADLRCSMPKQSLPRVAWSLGNSSSDGCAPLAASAVREIGPKTSPACFPTLLTGIAVASIRLSFSVQFQGFIPGTCGLASPLQRLRAARLTASAISTPLRDFCVPKNQSVQSLQPPVGPPSEFAR
jgi:hypothetical protein